MRSHWIRGVAAGALVVAMLGYATTSSTAAGPPVDIPGVPHYFGPYPNWANSPLTVPQAVVEITGAGSGATAVANVDPATGGVTSIDVTNPGRGYVGGAVVTVTGGSPDATATASVVSTGGVIGFTGLVAGGGYTSLNATIAAPPPGGTTATATATGGVDHVTISNPGSGYTIPTLSWDLPSDPNGTMPEGTVQIDASGSVTGVTITSPGSGYTEAPNVVINNGTPFDPVPFPEGGSVAVASATIALSGMAVDGPGSGYTSVPAVSVSDAPGGTGAGAGATAVVDTYAVSGITVDSPGSGYLTQGIRKFVDDLPGLCDPSTGGCQSGKAIPLGVPFEKTYNGIAADEYVIGLVQYLSTFSSDLPPTLVRGYVQLETPDNAGWSQHFPLTNALLNGTEAPVLDVNGQPVYAVTAPQYLGPIISSTKDKPVRIVFHNLLPAGSDGDLFLPTDTTLMGSGTGPDAGLPPPVNESSVFDEVRNPICTNDPTNRACYSQNRAVLHLHGGTTAWISDGTPHQWITPAQDPTQYPEGVSVRNVPDMNVCNADDDGCQTYYYTNQQSARMLFYHDHAYGITRLNVYAGEAAGYLITDSAEQGLISSGTIPGPGNTVPLIVQDKTFVPDDAQLRLQDPTWDPAKWGTKGSFWFHHVYMPAQNPDDPSGMSAFGRWMYGPWFWPPASNIAYPPIDNPYYDASCDLNDPSTWQYDTDPFCEPKQIPGTPNLSTGMEQFNDTPIVNGVAYPKVTLQPQTYRFRVLNAAGDRFFNFQWYIADPNQGNGKTEVALNPGELEAAQTDPNVFPTPVQGPATAGPDWIQIASEGGFLPAPVVVDGQQPTTFITDPARFDVGNVDLHSLLLGPAERADVIVDFSKFKGKTLILYNDAPAAFPARVPVYDYYTGGPDLSPVGAPTTLPGYGPNTRTVMQVTIADVPAAPAFDLRKLQTAFQHKANGSGVFESSQHPIIVGQAAYNSAYGTSFSPTGNCNVGGTGTVCDGYVRINDTTTFGFNTLRYPKAKLTMPLQPKAIHDEMNSTSFDPYGRMQATLGIEAQPPTPATQNVTLYPYINPQTELIDGTNLPPAATQTATGYEDIHISAIGSATDGSQIWRITHNGVDTHPIHFHLYDVQVINRVTWDNIIIPPDPAELGWKDTVRISPLEDTIVALRPVIPQVPFEVPNAVRTLNPAEPLGSAAGFQNIGPDGQPLPVPITNDVVNFGWEYVYHCHILTHEEMDMMRPVSLAMPPLKASIVSVVRAGNAINVTFNDNSITEQAFQLQRTTNGTTYTTVASKTEPLIGNVHHSNVVLTDPSAPVGPVYGYRIAASNTVGYGSAFSNITATSYSATVYAGTLPAAPTNAVADRGPGTDIVLTWTDNSDNENGFVVQRKTGAGSFVQVATPAAGSTSWTDPARTLGTTYQYRVAAVNLVGTSAFATSNALTPQNIVRLAPTNVTGVGGNQRVTLTWTAPAPNGGPMVTGYAIQRSSNGGGTWTTATANTGSATTTFTVTGLASGANYVFRVAAINSVGTGPYSAQSASIGTWTTPGAPTNLVATAGVRSAALTWAAPANTGNGAPITGYYIQRSSNSGGTWTTVTANTGSATTSYVVTGLTSRTRYIFRVAAINPIGSGSYSANSNSVTVL